MKVDPTTQVTIQFDPVSVEWYLLETVKVTPFRFKTEQISPNYSSLAEAEQALAAVLEVYDAAMEACTCCR